MIEEIVPIAKASALRLARRYGVPVSDPAVDDAIAGGYLGGILAAKRYAPGHGTTLTTWIFPNVNRYAEIALRQALDLGGGRFRPSRRAELTEEVATTLEDEAARIAFEEAEDRVDRLVSASRVRQAVAALPERERSVIRGLYWSEQTTYDLASELRLSASGVRKIRDRALGTLREALADLAPETRLAS